MKTPPCALVLLDTNRASLVLSFDMDMFLMSFGM
jgi:hypothetical protein